MTSFLSVFRREYQETYETHSAEVPELTFYDIRRRPPSTSAYFAERCLRTQESEQ
jgi:hypothetical protein